MTDKLKLFKVRLASGAERFVVGPTGADVWGLKFSTAKSPEETGQDCEIVSVESIVPVDFVLLREPVPEQCEQCEKCDKWLYRSNGQLQPCGWCAQGGYALDPKDAAAALGSAPHPDMLAEGEKRYTELAALAGKAELRERERIRDSFSKPLISALPSEARSTWAIGDACPQCGNPLHATLGQLVCSLGHQVRPVPEGAFHAHAESLGPQPWCKACQREGRIPQRETLGG